LFYYSDTLNRFLVFDYDELINYVLTFNFRMFFVDGIEHSYVLK